MPKPKSEIKARRQILAKVEKARPKHTPLPWKLSPDNTEKRFVFKGKAIVLEAWPATIAMEEAKANAKFIVRACNSHYELLEACKGLLAGPNWPGARMTARAAVAKAEGKHGA